MIVKKALSLIAAIAAMAAAAAVCVVAAAFALYALARYYIGPAGGAAVVAVVAAIAALILAFVCFRKVKPRPERRRDEESVATRLIDLAREKPIIAAGVAAAAGLVVLRNPSIVGAIVSAAMTSRAREAERREKRERRR